MIEAKIIGNLTNDPVLKTVMINNVPTKVVNFSVAANETGKKDATYFRVHAWRGQAENCAAFLKKGRKVYISGPVRLNSYKDSSGAIRYAMELRGDTIEFLDRKPAEEGSDELETLDESQLPFVGE